jgi:hypothetical protein
VAGQLNIDPARHAADTLPRGTPVSRCGAGGETP